MIESFFLEKWFLRVVRFSLWFGLLLDIVVNEEFDRGDVVDKEE